jgi:hypothetical protein
MIALSLLLSFCAFSALSLAMNRHHQQVFGRAVTPRRQTLLRIGGALLLLLALPPAIRGWGLSVGLAVWCVQLTLAAQAQLLLLTYRPAWAVRASAASGLACILRTLAL